MVGTHKRRRGTAAVSRLGLSIAALVGVTGCAATASTIATEPREQPTSVAESPVPVGDAESALDGPRPVPDDPDPIIRAGAAGQLVLCSGPVHLGGWSPDFGGPGSAASPEEGLEAFLDLGLFGLPSSGYEQRAAEDDQVLFTYDVEGQAKVTVIIADASSVGDLEVDDGWVVETFATCDPAEYAASEDDEIFHTVWTDADGDRVPTSTITSFQGAEHCDWESVIFLRRDGRQYVRDPDGVLASETVSPYDDDTQLPDTAVNTGYRQGDDELWLSADDEIAYLVTADAVEAWPAARDLIGCA